MSQQMNILLEIRDKVARIEERCEAIPELKDKIEEQQAKLASHDVRLVKLSGEVKAIRWIAKILLVTVPATAAAVVKMFKA